ncbi:MAG TPA: malectin domain-containing carbohydrate-binding protein, partial [Armatimonadota bacterium]|nr:malectin domain-containing carbohydrate-binding protein [Armatimonadota bacterium]
GHGGKGSRIFNVAINGTPALTDFDIFAEAGGANIAVVKDVTAKTDSTGLLRITLTPATSTVDKNPTINGIEVLQ